MSYVFRYDDLPTYDLATAKVGDEVIIVRYDRWSNSWFIFCCKVKSVSAKRRDVTFSNADRYTKGGMTIGGSYYNNTVFLQNVDKVRERVKEYQNTQKYLNETKRILDALNRGCYAVLSDLTPEKLVEFHDILKEFFPDLA